MRHRGSTHIVFRRKGMRFRFLGNRANTLTLTLTHKDTHTHREKHTNTRTHTHTHSKAHTDTEKKTIGNALNHKGNRTFQEPNKLKRT